MSVSRQQLVCVVCPLGCTLTVEPGTGGAEPEISGFGCRRGLEYARAELTDPRRVLTTSVTAAGGTLRRLPVKTAAPIPKRLLLQAAESLRGVRVSAPVAIGDVIVRDLLGTGVSLVATRDLSSQTGPERVA